MPRFFRAAVASALAVFLFGTAGRAVEPGEIAPAFDLPFVTGEGSLASAAIFPDHEYSFLVFWTSGCARCVEALGGCEDFHRTYGGAEVMVVGVCAAGVDPLAVRGIIQASGLSFPQLRDVDESTARRYGVPRETFAVFLVGRDGGVIDASVDPEGDTFALMESMLAIARGTGVAESSGGTERTGDTASAGVGALGGLVIHGTERIRFLSVDSRGSGAVGAYGEAIDPGNRLHYRFEIELTKQVAGALRVGALLRVGNEGKRVLESGPKYLGSEWGSVFAEIEGRGARLRIGYYPIAMTPLTLMRWDWEDNPRLGGYGGCGCGASAGALLVESLDELAPELTVEGASALWSVSDVEARAFYAMPLRSRASNYMSYRAGVDERARYALELFGFEGKWRRHDARTGSFWEAAVHAIGTAEDRRTVDFLALGYPSADPWTSTWTVTVSGGVPIVCSLRLRGEVVAYNRSDERGIEGAGHAATDGDGGYGGLLFERTNDLFVALDYIRLDERFNAPFAALSYEPNAEGLRASARLAARGVSASLFYKRTTEVRAPSALAERAETELAGAAVEAPAGSLLAASVGWLERTSWRRGSAAAFDEYRRALTASVRHEFARAGALELRYQKITSRDNVYEYDLATESRSDLYSVHMTVEF